MDIKMLKTKVCTNTTVTAQTVEQGIDVDFTLPDYCPPVSRILKCKLIPRINSKNIGAGTAMVDGSATILLIYADMENRICSFEYVVPLAKSIELKEDCKGARINCRARSSYCNCRAVTERKMDVHGAVELDIRIVCTAEKEIVCDADCGEVQLRRSVAPATNPMGYCEKGLVIEDDIELSHGQPEISSIIRYEANPCISECKIISGKVLLKGELILRVLYCPVDSSRPVVSRSAVPFSQVMDIEGIHEQCECDTRIDLAYLEVKPKISTSGEIRCLSLNAKLILRTDCFCPDEIPVVLDAYCTRHSSKAQTQNIGFDKIISTVNENYICKKRLEFSDDALGSVLDMWCETNVSTVRLEGNVAVLCGTVQVCMLVYDVAGNATYQERPIEFEFKNNLPHTPDNFSCDPQIEVVNCSFTIVDADALEVQVELKICAAVYERKILPVIVDISVGDELEKSGRLQGAVVAYYAEKGENVWDIARRYNGSVDEIMALNTLESDILEVDKALLICL